MTQGSQTRDSWRVTTKILVIEDDASIARSLMKELQAESYEVELASRGDEGLAKASEDGFDVVITDLMMPGLSGLDLVEQLHRAKPRLPIILMTAYGTTETAIEATRLGAYDYVLKPFEPDELLDTVAKAAACNQFMSAPLELGKADPKQPSIVGRSRAMQKLYKEIGRAAATSVTVLIRGETGTGKELVARAVHQHSARSEQPFIAVNCSAIPETLLESELFGHEQGAFTGAHARRVGRFEQAKRGTVFLDEIGDLGLSAQVKLLRVLQEKCIQRVGGNEFITVEARVVAAMHRDLESAVREKQFREDLLYRLSACTILVPPLNERTEDIPELVKYFLVRYSKEIGVDSPAIQPEAIEFLKTQAWPGNIRELENAISHALLLARDHPISLEHTQQAYARTRFGAAPAEQSISGYFAELLSQAQQPGLGSARSKMIEDMERELFSRAIRLARGNQAKAARWLGVTRGTMREKLIHFGLHSVQDGLDPFGK